jgi:benzylsuccinate CoA-transferase BbsF subunit
MTEKLLDEVKVVDFTQYIAGPLVTKLLADFGATVIRIEGRTRLGGYRTLGPFKDNIPGADRSASFIPFHSGELSLAINLGRPKSIDLVKRMITWADIVVENFTGGVMQRIGLGYDELKVLKPDIIMLSSCMMGQTGPHATHPGTGNQLTALSGFDYISGWNDRQPVTVDAYTDFIAPLYSALTILAALDYRRRTGKGQYIDISQYEAGIQFLTPLVLDYVANGRIDNRNGNRSDYAAPHGVYRCRGEDRWCAIAVYCDTEWEKLCRVMGKPLLAKDPRFSTFGLRKRNEDELDKVVEEWTVNYSPEDVMNRLQEAGVGAGVVETSEDILDHDPQLKHHHFFWMVEHPEIGKYRAQGHPFVLSKSPYEVKRVPLLGEHNEYVCREILGLPDDEIALLVEDGVIE